MILIRKDDKYAMYYGKIGLVLFIGWVIVLVLRMIPIVGWIIYLVGSIILLVGWIVGWVAALSGEEKKLPILSDIADKINL